MLIPLDEFDGLIGDVAHFINMERGEGTRKVSPEQARAIMAARAPYCGWWQ